MTNFPIKPPTKEERAKEPKADFFAVLDFEATCEDGDRNWRNEVIEFPVVAMEVAESPTSASGVTLRPAGEFREFVRPTEVPALTAFCTSLTGITQADVGGARALPEVMDSFGRWLGRRPRRPA